MTITSNTSAWTFNNEEVEYVKLPLAALVPAMHGESLKATEIALEHEDEFSPAIIQVENINGPIPLLSAKDDELWPSQYMSEKIISRLGEKDFKYRYLHFSFDGGHHDIQKHFDKVFEFFFTHFK